MCADVDAGRAAISALLTDERAPGRPLLRSTFPASFGYLNKALGGRGVFAVMKLHLPSLSVPRRVGVHLEAEGFRNTGSSREARAEGTVPCAVSVLRSNTPAGQPTAGPLLHSRAASGPPTWP
ncbi:hypothetical protein AAFF_G00421480 [Aldrovandia affinis]|uniref:Uncharacterized protein n=1 Tax=Aldrovandia affinis TaxID=143900 RepID=A0AAD7S9U7_9TELE|nr:hypothetical protein AAFF_G00421480 [Aldrovandia affinis]